MTLNVIQWNINGYTNNYGELQILIKKYNPKIIALQETHIHNYPNIPIPINYSFYHLNTSTTRYGGVALLIHNSLKHEKINTPSDFDALRCAITSKQNFCITTAYIPPNKNFSTTNLQNMFADTGMPYLITGDFNGSHTIWGASKTNKKGETIFNFLNDSNLILLNDKSPTHLNTYGTYSYIDLSFCSPSLIGTTIWKTENHLCGSDHFPIIISLFPNTSQTCSFKPKFRTQNADWKKYKENCLSFDITRSVSTNVNKESANLSKIILQSANISIPQTKVKINNKVSWWNKILENLKTVKNRAWLVFKRNMTQINLLNYKKANSKYKRQIKISKKKSLANFTSTINPLTPVGAIWSNIRTFTGYKISHKIHCITSVEDPSRKILSKVEMAAEFAKYWSNESSDDNFENKFHVNKEKFKSCPPVSITCKQAGIIEEDITFIELESVLGKLKGKTPGMDRISYPMLKMLPRPTKQRMVKLFNEIFCQHIPQKFKTSIIVPILKPGSDKTMAKSYRPISLNPCISKVLDRIIANRLWWFLKTNKLLNNFQFGFKRGKSTLDNLLFLDYQITNALSTKNHITIISLDFQRAFDRVGLHSIIDQLTDWQVGPKIINYIYNFMTNRKIIVRIENQYSASLPLHNGIPQGSPLSVVIFLIAYNKLYTIISIDKRIHLSAYADDINLIIKSKEKNPTLALNGLFDNIKDWCEISGAILSDTKCKYIHICRKKNCHCTIQSGNFSITEATTLRLLGLYINQKYNWKDHISFLSTSLSKRLNVIKCLSSSKFNCNISTLTSIIRSLMLSKVNYLLPIYGQAPKPNIKKIETIINSAIRMALGAFRTTPIKNLLFESNILPFSTQKNILTAKLFRTLIYDSNTPLKQIVRKIVKTKKVPKVQSVIYRSVQKCRDLNIPVKANISDLEKHAPWVLSRNIFDISMTKYLKSNTNPLLYQTLFNEIRHKLYGYIFLYTDGSKSDISSSFSLTTENEIINISLLPPYSSVYTTELIAIHEALLYVRQKTGKFVICTDSLSAVKSIMNINNNNFYISRIRNLLANKSPNVKVLWLPGHCNIQGNEFADSTAKNAAMSPVLTTPNLDYKDLNSHIHKYYYTTDRNLTFNTCSTWYRNINSERKFVLNDFTSKLSRHETIKFIRLRLGHTKITHGNLLNLNTTPVCTCAIYTNSPEHFLLECPHFNIIRNQIFQSLNPLQCLSNPTQNNIQKILQFLKITKLYKNI